MQNFRFFLAMIFAILPLVKAAYQNTVNAREKERTNIWIFLGRKIPAVGLLCYSVEGFLKTLQKRMRTSDNARKLYTVMLLIVMLVYTYVEYAASEQAAKVVKAAMDAPVTDASVSIIEMYSPMISDMYVLFACQLLTFAFFSYKFSNWILTSLHDGRELTWLTVLMILVIIFYSSFQTPRYMILAEVIYLILLASFYYPDRIGEQDPRGRQGIPQSKEHSMLKAA